MYLLDTNVVSELRRTRPHGAVVAWLGSVEDRHLFLSAVTVGGIQRGIEITRQQDARRADEIEAWLDQIVASYNILSMDSQVFRTWARIMAGEPASLAEDAMISATALVHDLVVVTRNVIDFDPFDVSTLNPFDAPQ